MTHSEALKINGDAYVKAMEFMLKMSSVGGSLDRIGFTHDHAARQNKLRKPFSLRTSEQYNGDEWLSSTRYEYNEHPMIKTTMAGGYPLLMNCRTDFMGNIRGIKNNTFGYNCESKDWHINITCSSSRFQTLITREAHGLTLRDTLDIDDEGMVFQHTLVNPEIPDELYDLVQKVRPLIHISPRVDKITLSGSSLILSVEVLDLETEFNTEFNIVKE